VPGEAGAAALARYAAQGVRVRVVTNSLAATDVAAVHAGYARRREALLRAGVRLYELKPDASALVTTSAQRTWLTFTGGSTASLHGKTFAIDRRDLFVGSLNFDPRSARLNTEMGLVISNPALAGSLADELDRVLPRLAYEVRLADDGWLEWIEQTDSGEVRYRSEPRASLARRLGAGFLSLLPIEPLL
jgi:cardiolipin synthase C